MDRYDSAPIELARLDREFSRADIVFHSVDHAGPSFEARVFLNNPDANPDTPMHEEAGYAGSFFIFGHGGCFGDEGHCDVPERRPYDPRRSHPLTPARKTLIATEALRRAFDQADTVTVSVVPVITSLTEKANTEDFLHFDSVELTTYR